MYGFNLVLLLLQQMCVFLVIAWLMSKTRLFIPLVQVTVRLPHKLLCYITFSIFCILGTYFGLHFEDSIANTRAIGAVMGGLLGPGGGWPGGAHRRIASLLAGGHDGGQLYDFHHYRRAAGGVDAPLSDPARAGR